MVPIQLTPPDPRDGGPLEIEPNRAIRLALENRLDLRRAIGEVYDSQRNIVVMADALKMGLGLTGGASLGSGRGLGAVESRDGRLRVRKGTYMANLQLDLPLERTAERNAYRASYIALEQSVRDVQELEDQIKLSVRNALRMLLETRESIIIQARSVQLAERRVQSTALFLQAGRAEIRDILEAQESLVSAQNALTTALASTVIEPPQSHRNSLGVFSDIGETPLRLVCRVHFAPESQRLLMNFIGNA